MAKGGKGLVKNMMELILGLVMLPVIAGFIVYAINDNNTSQLQGVTLVLPIIGIAIGFGLVLRGLGII